MSSAVTPLLGGLIALILVALAFGDSKLIFGRYTSQTVQLDRAIADPAGAEGGPRAAPRRVRRLGQRRQARPRERPDSRGRSLEGRLTHRPVTRARLTSTLGHGLVATTTPSLTTRQDTTHERHPELAPRRPRCDRPR